MPPMGNNPPPPVPQQESRRFSPEVVKEGDAILDGVSFFDSTIRLPVRIVKSAVRKGTLAQNQKFSDLSTELQSYLAFRIKKNKENAAMIEEAEEIDRRERSMKEIFGSLQGELQRLHPEDDAKRIEEILRFLRDQK